MLPVPALSSCNGMPSDEKYWCTSFGSHLLKHVQRAFLQEALMITLAVNKK